MLKEPIKHIVVKGDTLSTLCEFYYGNTDYVEMIAKYNHLNKFRGLKAGETLIFPPVVSEE